MCLAVLVSQCVSVGVCGVGGCLGLSEIEHISCSAGERLSKIMCH